jgi:CRISPR-associated endonuclease/helicase Cas3
MTHDDFSRFFHALNNYDPFPWQLRLAESVTRKRTWPGVIALPTAAGKTAILDIAIFALALEAGLSPAKRHAPRRIFYVVDRRIIVDEVLERSRRIAGALSKARDGSDGILREVADCLMSLGGNTPLQVSAMRGGMYRDNGWAQSPAQPTVCISTVDQVGSRLLFRGYGLRNGVCNPLPIHAGLVANDALLILDEAHLSQPFAETLDAIKRYREWAESAVRAPWHFVQMSATPREGRDSLAACDDDFKDLVLGPRLSAHKRAALIQVKCDAASERDSPQHRRELEAKNSGLLVEEMCKQACELRDASASAAVVAVIFNRVAPARAAFERLRADADAILLTGRTRPYDRDRLLERWRSRLDAGRPRDEANHPLFVVATQCIEVGANFDFDALVTECAALDALRQRFGRLDRLGARGESRASIVGRSDQIKRADDAVYGPALAETWKWLGTIAVGKSKAKTKQAVDFGTVALAKAIEQAPTEAFSPSRHGPVVLPAHLDLWAQTSPIPVPDPEVSVFLHGPEVQLPDVQVIWRADVDLSVRDSKLVSDIVRVLPPSSVEAISVPFAAARAWLASLPAPDIADVEGMRAETRDEDREGRRAFRWRGIDNSEIITPKELHPGDTIVVAATYGGCDEFGWNPACTQAVRDIADMAAVRRSIPILRLHRALIKSWFTTIREGSAASILGGFEQLLTSMTGDDETDETAVLTDLLDALARLDGVAEDIRRIAGILAHDSQRRVIRYTDDNGIAVIGSRKARERLRSGSDIANDLQCEFTDEDDASVMIRREVTLQDHSNGVKDFTRRFAAASGLSRELADDLELAAWLHDLGKADRRFQLMLHGGDEFKLVTAVEPLAKSRMDPGDPASRRAREISCYPDGGRHECQSVALIVANANALQRAHDHDLVPHLVGSHHGCGRPFMPVVYDPNPEGVSVSLGGTEFAAQSDHRLERLDSGVSDRFWRLIRRYGWYGLAYLETILRLADHRCSEAEENQDG